MRRPYLIAVLAGLAFALPDASAFHRKQTYVSHGPAFAPSGVAFAPNVSFSAAQVSYAPVASFAPAMSFAPAGGCYGGSAASFAPAMSFAPAASFAPAGGCYGGVASGPGFPSGGPSAALGIGEILGLIRGLRDIRGLGDAPRDDDRRVGSDLSNRLSRLEDKFDTLDGQVDRIERRLSQLEGKGTGKIKPKKPNKRDIDIPDRTEGRFSGSSLEEIEKAAAAGDTAGVAMAMASTDRLGRVLEGLYYSLGAELKRNPMHADAVKMKGAMDLLSKHLERMGRKPTM